MEERTVIIGIAQMGVARSDEGTRTILKTTLGSCVGVIITDPVKGVHGLAHILLPKRTGADPVAGKYADTALPELVAQMERAGGSREDMRAHLVGGADMFQKSGVAKLPPIGEMNVEMCLAMLSKLGIPVLSQDTGGDHGRMVTWNGIDKLPRVRTLGAGSES